MKIGILTHPLVANYGGILQCYALNTYLKRLGHEPIVIDRKVDKDFFLKRWIRISLKTLHLPPYYKPNQIDRTVNIRPFVENNIERTLPIDSAKEMKNVCKRYGLEAVIVGSDQVWRCDYAMLFEYDYFLDFVPQDVIKLSYAASLGLSHWHYNAEQTSEISKLLSRFKAVSVREDEAVDMLMYNTSIRAEHLIDPTLLLTANDYDAVASPRLVNRKYVFVYWLGDKSQIVATIAKYKKDGYEIIDINLRDIRPQERVEDWLSLIKNADLVITDSFHGCVFSIIFNVLFINHANESGGNGRIRSLFKQLGIANKLIYSKYEINYSAVNATIKLEQQKSETFLKNALAL